jgi:hypothetical protein
MSYLPRQLAEETFCTIPADRNAKPFADDYADTARPRFGPANEQIKARSGQPTAMLLHKFDVAARSKKKGPISCTLRHRPAHSGPRKTRPPDSCVPSSAGPLRDALGKRPCLRKTRGRKSVQREDLDRQTRAALGSTAGQDFPAVFCAHAFAEPVFSLLLEVRRLLKRKRHTGHPFEQFRVNVAL